jgi:hypothetical protein
VGEGAFGSNVKIHRFPVSFPRFKLAASVSRCTQQKRQFQRGWKMSDIDVISFIGIAGTIVAGLMAEYQNYVEREIKTRKDQ